MYRRTNGKEYIPQMAAIECWEARLRRLRLAAASEIQNPILTSTPESHHHIADSQNDAVELKAFLQQNTGDPAVKVRQQIILGDTECQSGFL